MVVVPVPKLALLGLLLSPRFPDSGALNPLVRDTSNYGAALRRPPPRPVQTRRALVSLRREAYRPLHAPLTQMAFFEAPAAAGRLLAPSSMDATIQPAGRFSRPPALNELSGQAVFTLTPI